MPLESSAGLLPKALLAALVGSVAGGTAGVWSLNRPVASMNAAAPAASPVAAPGAPHVATPSATTATTDNDIDSSRSTSLPTRVTPKPQAAPIRTNAAAPSANEETNVLQRAQTLARRPDVAALLALRDDVVRRAKERGIEESPSVKSELDEVDQRLNEARALQLKLDAEQFRKADSKP
jgi:hypothetical protein